MYIILDRIGLFNLAIFDRITAEGQAAERELARVRERENFMSALLKGQEYR